MPGEAAGPGEAAFAGVGGVEEVRGDDSRGNCRDSIGIEEPVKDLDGSDLFMPDQRVEKHGTHADGREQPEPRQDHAGTAGHGFEESLGDGQKMPARASQRMGYVAQFDEVHRVAVEEFTLKNWRISVVTRIKVRRAMPLRSTRLNCHGENIPASSMPG